MPVGRWRLCVPWFGTADSRSQPAAARAVAGDGRGAAAAGANRRLHILLKREGWRVNSKRVYRIYVEEKLVVRRRRRRRRILVT
jgi:putative transposase